MNDLISRRAVIDAIAHTECEFFASEWEELTKAIMNVPSEPCKVIAEVKVDTDEIMKRVNEEILPLIPKWIPVTERLPEVGGTYIVTGRMKYEWDKKYDYFVDAAAYSPVDGWDTFHDNYEGQQDFAIIAWMPLPEPYKEEQEDDH